MEPLEIAGKIKERFSEEVKSIAEFRGEVSVVINKEKILEICRWLKDNTELKFDYLKDLCGVDHLGKKPIRFEVVYTLYSMMYQHMIRLKAGVEESNPVIESVISVWIGADWHERECYDMFGIVFQGHPDLRRIFMPEDWEGYPLRKDYPAEGPEKEWPGFQEVLDRAQELKDFAWRE